MLSTERHCSERLNWFLYVLTMLQILDVAIVKRYLLFMTTCRTLLAQSSGTAFLNKLSTIVSSACDITTKPFKAFNISLSEPRMAVSSLLYRITSWVKTVFIDSSYFTGYFSMTGRIGIGSGTLSKIERPISSTIWIKVWWLNCLCHWMALSFIHPLSIYHH